MTIIIIVKVIMIMTLITIIMMYDNNQESKRKKYMKLPKWKVSGPCRIQGYWLNIFRSPHTRISEHHGDTPEWMTKDTICLIINDESQGYLVSIFRPMLYRQDGDEAFARIG